jgi:integrase/recombinase XerD
MTALLSTRLRSLKPAEWPERHRRAWEAALRPGDLLDEAGAAAEWRPRSRAKTATGYGLWLAWHLANGRNLVGGPEALVTREYVRGWLDKIAAQRSSYTMACRAQELFDAVRVLVPGLDWAWLAAISDRARKRARPSRNKIERLRSADEIERLGDSLMSEAHDPGFRGTPLQQARQFRDGLIIALLVARLPRLKNITQIEMGRHLIQCGKTFTLAFSAGEMKSRRASQVTLPDRLIPWVRLYLDWYRPVLLGNQAEDHGLLWVSMTGTPLAEVSLHNAVRRRTKAAFGKPIPPHWFRDAGVTTVVIHNPRHARDSRELLDHSSHRTWEDHYNQGQAIHGARRYQDVIAELMSEDGSLQSG